MSNMNLENLYQRTPHGNTLFPIALYTIHANTPGRIFPPHWHDELEFIYVSAGEIIFNINHEIVTVQAGECLFINSAQLHCGFSITSDAHCFSIIFNVSLLTHSLDITQTFFDNIRNNTYTLIQYFKPEVPLHQEVIKAIRNIIDALTNKDLAYELTVKSKLLAIFSLLIKNAVPLTRNVSSFTAEPPNYRRLEQIIEYIDANYKQKIVLSDISRSVHITPQYLCRFFKSMTHMSIVDYINHYRIQQARALLEVSPLSITDIALECGFDNISYFNRVFKQQINCTPSQFRLLQNHRNEENSLSMSLATKK